MRWVIMDGTQITYGPINWHAQILSTEINPLGLSVSLPADEPAEEIILGSVSVRPVTEVSVSVSASQKVTGETLDFSNGVVSATPIVENKTQEEMADLNDYMAMIRNERDRLIEEIFWRVERNITQVAGSIPPDDDGTKMTAIYTYLQDLRDLPNENPYMDTKAEYDALVWPTKPA